MTNRRYLVTTEGENVATTVLYADSTFYDIFDFDLIRGDRKKVLAQPNSIVVTEDYAQRIWGTTDAMGKTIIFNTNEKPLWSPALWRRWKTQPSIAPTVQVSTHSSPSR